MWGVDDDGSHWIGGMLIDAAEQNRGVGRATVRTLAAWLGRTPGSASRTTPTTSRPQPSTRPLALSPSLPVTFLIVPSRGPSVARPGMTSCPCRSDD
ncbi:hypothetical protein ACLQ28_32695, partial [Micromonospora sp. DT201]